MEATNLPGPRIRGTFTKQMWVGPKADRAMNVGEEEFDATDAVLLMEHERLVGLDDDDESSDEIGRAHVDWDGPFHVQITDSICRYFGVEEVSDVTPEMLWLARQQVNPQEPVDQVINLRVRLTVRAAPGTDVREYVNGLKCSFSGHVTGVTLRSSEIVAHEAGGGDHG